MPLTTPAPTLTLNLTNPPHLDLSLTTPVPTLTGPFLGESFLREVDGAIAVTMQLERRVRCVLAPREGPWR